MLKTLFKVLNKDLTGKTWEVEAKHPYFGQMVLFAFKNSDKSYWEAELDHDGDSISVGIEAPDRNEPSDLQVAFAQNILSNVNTTFARAAPLLEPEFERWHKESFPSDWKSAFKFVGFFVPAHGDECNAWQLSYESLRDRARHHFTCYFENGKPHHVTVDG